MRWPIEDQAREVRIMAGVDERTFAVQALNKVYNLAVRQK